MPTFGEAAVKQPSDKMQSIWRGVLEQTRGHRSWLTLILALELISTPLSLLSPLGIKIAVDCVIGGQPLPHYLSAALPGSLLHSPARLLMVAAGLQLIVVLLTQSHGFFAYMLKLISGQRLILQLRTRLFQHLQHLPLDYHDHRGTVDSSFRVQHDAPAIKSITVDGALFLLSDIVKLSAIACVTMFVNWRLAIAALSVTPLLILYSMIYQKRVGGRYKHVQKLESFAATAVQEALSAIRVVKAFGQERTEERRFLDRSNSADRERIRLAYSDGAFGFAINVTTGSGMALVLLLGIRSVQSGSVSLGSFLMIITYLVQLYTPLQNITYHIASLQSSSGSLSRAFEILSESRETTGASSKQPEYVSQALATDDRAAGSIEFKDVTFGYAADHPVLRDVCLNVAPGTRVGVVGRTGAGKSTFVDMLVRFRDPDLGQILLDGIDLREYPLNYLRRQFAFVLQDPALFSTTVAQNIAYGVPGATRHQIVEAAKAANAHQFITQLPQGYETEIGERGSMLSGGERQRVAIARAFLKDAPILILDEPTSALDAKTEGDILQSVERLARGRTTFLISHRLTTLSGCDTLLKLEKTRATEIPVPCSLVEIESFVFSNETQSLQAFEPLEPIGYPL